MPDMSDPLPRAHTDSLTGYNLWSSHYDAMDNPLIAMVDRALETHPEPVADRRVLELGCGTARLAPYFLSQSAASYTGVDASPGMLGRARAQMQDARVQLIEADIAAPLSLPANSFDLIIISLVLEHFSSLTPILQNAARLLAPQGTLRILELHPTRQRAGTSAHFLHEGQDIRLPSYPHDIAEFQTELGNVGLPPTHILEHSPDSITLARSPKLSKYEDLELLLDIRANTR